MKTKKWIGFDFNRNGWATDHENRSDAWTVFVRDFRSDLRRLLKGTGWTLHVYKGNWFSGSGFFYNEEKDAWLYFSHSDVRYFRDGWLNTLLVRYATGPTDYGGGSNCYTHLYNLPEFLKYYPKF